MHISEGRIAADPKFTVTAKKAAELQRYRLEPGHIVLGRRGEMGRCAVVSTDHADMICGTGSMILIPNPEKVDSNYAAHLISTPSSRRFLENAASGVTMLNLNPSAVAKLPLPLPPLTEQRRIAAVLDQADGLRRLRRQSLSRLNELRKAIFIQMFGDPITNSKALDTRKLGSLGTLDRGRSQHRPRNDPALLGGPYPLIQTGEVARSLDFVRSYSATYSEMGLRQSKMWKKGTLCITIAANIADTAILDFDACFPDSVVGFDAGSDHINFFVHSWLTLIRGEIERVAPAVGQKNINLAVLRDLDIIAPDADLVEAYYSRMQIVFEQRQTLEANDEALDQAFTSLQHHAFRGEL
jgi:type I restriction enzyme S subunit